MADDKKPEPPTSQPVQSLIDDFVHGTFVTEGTMVAFPTCFPGASVPIPADESRITALEITYDCIVYGGTSGRRTHLFFAMFPGVTGLVFDMGVVDGADHCAAVCCGYRRFLACVNGPGGGRVVGRVLQHLPYDCIQEWGFSRRPFEEIGPTPGGERVIHAVTDASRTLMVGITDHHLFTVGIDDVSHIEVIGEVPGAGRIAVGSDGGILGLDGLRHLWQYDSTSRRIDRRAVELPKGRWGGEPLFWAKDHHRGLLYTADDQGRLFAFHEARGFSAALAQATLAPVGPMAVSHDGRLFGFCGKELARLFTYDPARRQVSDLGVAASTLQRRRYGYVFGDAVTGRDGQIIFGENDNLGHLWLYFPRILPTRGSEL